MLRYTFKILAALLVGTGASQASASAPDAIKSPTLEQRLDEARALLESLNDPKQKFAPVSTDFPFGVSDREPAQTFSNWGNWGKTE